MKKVAQVVAVALIGMSLTVACKSKTTEPVEDTTPACCEQVMDTVDSVENVVEEPVVEEPVKTTTKTTAKKEEKKDVSKPAEMTKSNELPTTGGSQRGTAQKAEEKTVTKELPASGGNARARR